MANHYSANAQLVSRFCKALLDLALEKNQLPVIEAELKQLSEAIAQNAELQLLLTSPLLRAQQKQGAIVAILQKSNASPLLINFIGVVAQNNRLSLLQEIADGFAALTAQLRGEVEAEVTSARPLDAGQIQKLQQQLGQMMAGKKVIVQTKVDPSLLGGLSVRIGSVLIDSSLRSKLDQMGLALKGAA